MSEEQAALTLDVDHDRQSVDTPQVALYGSASHSPFFVGNLTTSDVTRIAGAAVRDAVAERKRNGHPIAKYDKASGKAYLEYPDMTRKYINGQ